MTVVCFILSLIPSSSEASNINLGTGVGSILACCVQDTANLKATAHLLLNVTYSPKWDINMEAYRHNENVKTGLQALIVEEKQSGTWAVSQEQSLEGCSHHVPVCQVLPLSTISDITLGTSNITYIFLTFLTDESALNHPSENQSRVCVVLVVMSQDKCVVPFHLCRQKPGVCQIF